MKNWDILDSWGAYTLKKYIFFNKPMDSEAGETDSFLFG